MIESNVIKLRPLRESDATRICHIINEEEIRQAMVTIEYPFSQADGLEFVRKSDTTRTKRFGLVKVNQDEVLGCVSLLEIDRKHLQAELSFFISGEASGQGLTTEAGKTILTLAFKSLYLNRIYAFHLVENLASAKILAKLGFKNEGVLRERVKSHERFYDVKLLSLLKKEWSELKAESAS